LFQYQQDRDFWAEVNELGQRFHREPGIEPLPADPALLALAARWGLDLLPDGTGIAALVDFCTAWWRHGEPPQEFVSFFYGFGHVPELDALPVRVDVVSKWHPDLEPRSLARERLISELDARLDEIERAWEEAGYSFPEETPKHLMHVQWLYLRLAHRRSVRQIADSEADRGHAYSVQAIYNQTNRLATLLGIALPPPNLN
jgi:uncharacterized protein YukE